MAQELSEQNSGSESENQEEHEREKDPPISAETIDRPVKTTPVDILERFAASVARKSQKLQTPACVEMPPPPPAPAEKLGQEALLDEAAYRDITSTHLRLKKDRVEAQLKAKAKQQAKLVDSIEKCRRASPCTSEWSKMDGVDRTRVCRQCKLVVYDFSYLTDEEAKQLVLQKGESRKLTFYKRQDGKFLLSDCPVGATARQVKFSLVSIIAILATVLAITVFNSPKQQALSGLDIMPKRSAPTEPRLQLKPGPIEGIPASPQSSTNRPPARATGTDYWSRITEDYWRYGAKRGQINIPSRADTQPRESQSNGQPLYAKQYVSD